MTKRYDPKSTAGKAPLAEKHVPLVVLGAGPAGLAAALAAARAGVEVMLVDEHPVAGSLMGLDVPFHFGQRMNAAVQNKARMIERVVETNPGIAEAFDLGIDVQLGIYCWGAFVNGPTLHTMPKPMVGLADDERSWMVSFDRLVVATGARDLGMSFAGWEKPGVMGARAALALIDRYKAFDGRKIAILGSGTLALQTAQAALAAGLGVAGIVDVTTEVQGADVLRRAIEAHGVKFFLGHAVKAAVGTAEVDGLVLVGLDAAGAPIAGSETTLACDTVVTAIGQVPTVELFDVLVCKLGFASERGGYVPEIGVDGQTSNPIVFAVGDCAGIDDGKSLDPAVAAAEGARAGHAAALSLGADPGEAAPVVPARAAPRAVHAYWQQWLEAGIAAGGLDVNVCQCEEVTRREVLEVQPPRYLNWGSSQMKQRDIESLAEDGPLNQDQVKRLTRAGMGPCQGRRCREQVQLLLARAGRTDPGAIPLASYRAPVRPLPLNVLAPPEESPEMRDTWEGWFGIPSMWTPHWELTAISPSVSGITPAADVPGK